MARFAIERIYRISVLNSAPSNINTIGNEEAQIHYLATVAGTKVKELSLQLKNVSVTGVGRGIRTAPTGNSSDIGTLNIKVEDSSFTGLTDEAVQFDWRGSIRIAGRGVGCRFQTNRQRTKLSCSKSPHLRYTHA